MILKVFDIYGCGGHLGSRDLDDLYKRSRPFLWIPHIKSGCDLIGQAVWEKKLFENG